MDLKKYAGEDVWVQLKAAEPWVTIAADYDGRPALARPPDNPEQLVPLPFFAAHVSDDGSELVINTGQGGRVALALNPDVIHSVLRVVEPATKIIKPTGPPS
jgi:hypothetical protein